MLLPLLVLACWFMVQETAAHGYLAVPISRNLYARKQGTFYDEMSGNGLGLSGSTSGPGAQQVFWWGLILRYQSSVLSL